MSNLSIPTRGGATRRPAVAAALLGLVTSLLALGLVAPMAQANPSGTDLVISEVYGGGGNAGATYTHDFIELYNPTGDPISLNNKSLQYRAAATTTVPGSSNIFALPNATVPAHGNFLVQCASGGANGVALPNAADTTTCALNLSGTTGQIYLVNATTGVAAQTNSSAPWTFATSVIDFVGFGTASIFEGTGAAPAPSVSRSITRNSTGTDGNNNAADFTFTTTMTPTNAAATPGPLAATDPTDVIATVGTPLTPITLAASGGTAPYTWEISGLPDGISETSEGVIGGTPTGTGVSTVTATVTDSATTPDSKSVEFTITVNPAPVLMPIAEVQGTPATQGAAAASPKVGQRVIVRGVVTGRYPAGAGNLAGFYLQTGGEEGVDYDTPGASDALFVYTGSKTPPAIGASVEVVGEVEERFFSTQIASPAPADTITVLGTPLPAVVPGDTLPGTDCALPGADCLAGAALETLREEHEGEAYLPTDDYTVTDSYDGTPFTQDSSRGFQMQGEIGLAANSTEPLMIPTETIDQSDTAALTARKRWNDAHAVILDDGADRDYTNNTNEDEGLPWLAPANPVRVGAPVTFLRPVILEFRRDFWRVQPETRVEPNTTGADRVVFANTRTNAPEDVLGAEGDLKIATFNMLNYFNTFGETWAASDGTATGNPGTSYNFANPRRCSYYTDRGPVGGGSTPPAARLTNDECTQDAVDPLTGLNVKLPGPRGAANQANFDRQEDKELEAINTIDADVMSLEEVENSIKLYDAAIDGPTGADKDRDDALKRLVQELNAHWLADHPGETNRWAYVASPRPEALPTITEQDAIRSAFIYNPSKVEPVGRSQVLVNSAPFRNAREPLAQAFKPLGGGRADAFGVIVNHFKSKGGPTAPATVNGDNVDSGDGAGFYNGDRKRQAAALVAFADQFAADRNIGPMFLTGDFNSYSAEDPVQVIEAGGFTNLKPTNGETTYSFGGLAGSLDHVFANEAAEAMVTGEDVWSINSNESVYYEYSRFNASATDLYAVNPFRSSDHNPEIIGIDVGDNIPDPVVDTVQILATNDFHARLVDDPGSAAAGAASMAGAVKELRADNPDTVFAAAGDLIGASTFESFIQNDAPTIDALNEAGLEVSAVGNHEFDQGYDDLVTRVMPRASWEYIGANVVFKDTEDGHTAGDSALPETWCETLPNGRVVGFVGAVTEDLPTLVSASAIADIQVTSIVTAVNENADELKGPNGCGAEGPADLVIELVHEGAASTSYAAVTDNSTFGQIVAGANANVDAIVSGHTHLAYNHKVPVTAWVNDPTRVVKNRPVVSAGQYGANLNRLQFEFAPGSGDLVNIRQTVLQLKDYDPDAATQAIVDGAVAYANVQGNVVLGDIEDKFLRARRVGDDGQIVESRGGESTLGNLVAEMQRWKTGADIGFMNPGGLRADLLGLDGTPREVTYRQAANAQPFANTLVTMNLTGAQIKALLEQQWQRDADGNIPSRPFLRLGTSDGFVSTFDASKPEGSRITGMWLNSQPINPSGTYRVSATSFLAGAGDNFWAFRNGTQVQDTGKTDLQAVVDYLDEFAEHAVDEPLPVDYAQHQVGITFPGGAPTEYAAGSTLAFGVSSLAMTGVDDSQDTEIQLLLGDEPLSTFAVTNALNAELFDNFGTANVSVTVPEGVEDGPTTFTLRGVTTGTEVPVVVQTSDGLPNTAVSAPDVSMIYGEPADIAVAVDPSAATGTVSLFDGATLIATVPVDNGSASISLAAGSLPVGVHELALTYSGDLAYSGSQGTVTVTVVIPDPVVTSTTATAAPMVYGTEGSVEVSVESTKATSGALQLTNGETVIGSGNVTAGGNVTISVPGTALPPGTHELTVAYLGDSANQPSQGLVTLEVAKAPSETQASVSPVEVVVRQGRVTVSASVTAAGYTPTGSVQIRVDGAVVATRSLNDGSVTALLAPFEWVDTHTVRVVYLGDGNTEASETTAGTVKVVRATPQMTVTTSPAEIKVNKTRAVVEVALAAEGQLVTGWVMVRFQGDTWITHLSGGRTSVQLPKIHSTGLHTVTVDYFGSGLAKPVTKQVTFRVVR